MSDYILGIDPGPVESAYVCVSDDQKVLFADKVGNDLLIARLKDRSQRAYLPRHVAIESIKSFGKRVGAETFETCRMEGRILQLCADLKIPCFQYGRMKYGKTLIGEGTVINDTLLRRALLLRFGGDGETVSDEVIPDGEPGAGVYLNGPRKGQPRVREVRIPEPLHTLVGCSDKRSAFAVAIYHLDVSHSLPTA